MRSKLLPKPMASIQHCWRLSLCKSLVSTQEQSSEMGKALERSRLIWGKMAELQLRKH